MIDSREGELLFAKHFDPGPPLREWVTYEWQGGDLVTISAELLEQVDPESIWLGNILRRRVALGPYVCRIVEDRRSVSGFSAVRLVRERNAINWRYVIGRLWLRLVLSRLIRLVWFGG